MDSGYYETFNRANVTLIDISPTPIEAITASGPSVNGTRYEVDVIVFATGFDAMTGTLHKIDIRGIGGATLKEKWSAGPRTYLWDRFGWFSKLLHYLGAGESAVLSVMTHTIEQLRELDRRLCCVSAGTGLATIEPTAEAEDAWVAHVTEVANRPCYTPVIPGISARIFPVNHKCLCRISVSFLTCRNAMRSWNVGTKGLC